MLCHLQIITKVNMSVNILNPENLSLVYSSAGTAVITKDAAGLWTDGRYFIQAEAQLAGSGVTLYRMVTREFQLSRSILTLYSLKMGL